MLSNHQHPRKLGTTIAKGVFLLYRRLFSPALHFLAGPGAGCRFEPTCGDYSAQAIERHGFLMGGLITARRLCRCHPWGGYGWDPVPETKLTPDEALT